MPSNCHKTNSGEYAVRHNPPPYFTKLRGCATFDVPYTQLASDLSAGKLPAFSFITPNLIDDMHDGTVAQGDKWLAANLPAILNSPEYTSGSTAVFITWDEGEGGTATKCATNKTDVGCHVATIVLSPSTKPGTRSATLFNHYSLLAPPSSCSACRAGEGGHLPDHDLGLPPVGPRRRPGARAPRGVVAPDKCVAFAKRRMLYCLRQPRPTLGEQHACSVHVHPERNSRPCVRT